MDVNQNQLLISNVNTGQEGEYIRFHRVYEQRDRGQIYWRPWRCIQFLLLIFIITRDKRISSMLFIIIFWKLKLFFNI